MRDGIDEFTLLCETCGYTLEGQPPGSICPECGKPLAESLPERRDRVPGMWEVLTHPRSSFDAAAIEDPDVAGRRAMVRCMIAGAFITGAIVVGWVPWWLVHEGLFNALFYTAVSVVGAAMMATVAGLILLLLTWIESRGLRFFGARRGFRATRPVAETVCSHACVGWIVGSAVWFAGWVVVGAGVVHELFVPLGLLLAVLGAVAGLLIFEVLAYIGLRRCRFANRVGPERESEVNVARR